MRDDLRLRPTERLVTEHAMQYLEGFFHEASWERSTVYCSPYELRLDIGAGAARRRATAHRPIAARCHPPHDADQQGSTP